MARLESLYRYWEIHPPPHIIAAAKAGIKPKTKQRSGVENLPQIG